MAVSGDGRLASSVPANSSPDGGVAIATPAYGDSYCNNIITALDSHSGAVRHQCAVPSTPRRVNARPRSSPPNRSTSLVDLL
jgi:hypothetical protein